MCIRQPMMQPIIQLVIVTSLSNINKYYESRPEETLKPEIRVYSPISIRRIFFVGLHRDGGLIVKTTHAVGRTRLPCDATLLHIVEGLADDGCMLWDGRYPSPPQDDSALSIMHMKRNHEKTCKPSILEGLSFRKLHETAVQCNRAGQMAWSSTSQKKCTQRGFCSKWFCASILT